MKYLLIFAIFSFLHLWAQEIPEASIRKQARLLVQKMSDKEKAGQLIHFTLPGKKLTADVRKKIQDFKPGGIILFGNNLGSAREIKNLTTGLQNTMKQTKGLPLLISTDQEGGKVIRVRDGVTQFPGAMAIGQTQNPNYAYLAGFITSYQLKELGINLLLAPSLDINNNPLNPVIHVRSFGADTKTVVRMGCAYERGARLGGAVPVIKHFPGHGDTNVDSHKGLPQINKNQQQLLDMELIPFQTSIQQGAMAVMSAHIVYPQIDKKFPATLSDKVLGKILRKKLGFQGMVMTDAMEMDAISKNYMKYNTAELTIKAGVDVILLVSWSKNPEKYRKLVLTAIQKKSFQVDGKNLLEEALIRQISTKIKNGLFHEPFSYHKLPSQPIADYIHQQSLKRKKTFVRIERFGLERINRKISRVSIRSFQKPFLPLSKEQIKETKFFASHPQARLAYQAVGVPVHSSSEIGKFITNSQVKTLVLETNGEKSLQFAVNLVKKYSNKNFILLHAGNPFIGLPKSNNVRVLFSFSPTGESRKALVFNLFRGKFGKEVPPANLIFQ